MAKKKQTRWIKIYRTLRLPVSRDDKKLSVGGRRDQRRAGSPTCGITDVRDHRRAGSATCGITDDRDQRRAGFATCGITDVRDHRSAGSTFSIVPTDGEPGTGSKIYDALLQSLVIVI